MPIVADETKCPRCGGTAFREIDCGPDGYNDDITYTSEICEACGLYLSGWTNKWLVDCACWTEEEDAKEFIAQLTREG